MAYAKKKNLCRLKIINCKKKEQHKSEIKFSAISVRNWPLEGKKICTLVPEHLRVNTGRFKGRSVRGRQKLSPLMNGEPISFSSWRWGRGWRGRKPSLLESSVSYHAENLCELWQVCRSQQKFDQGKRLLSGGKP